MAKKIRHTVVFQKNIKSKKSPLHSEEPIFNFLKPPRKSNFQKSPIFIDSCHFCLKWLLYLKSTLKSTLTMCISCYLTIDVFLKKIEKSIFLSSVITGVRGASALQNNLQCDSATMGAVFIFYVQKCPYDVQRILTVDCAN